MSLVSPNTVAFPVDGRQSPTALAVARGTQRLLLALGLSCVCELPLGSGRQFADAGQAEREQQTLRAAGDRKRGRRLPAVQDRKSVV